MSEPIKFRHDYYKLSDDQFTTMRGKAQFKKRKVGEVVEIETPKENSRQPSCSLRLFG